MTLRKEVDKLAIALQKHVRLKAADSEGYITCITCGARKHWKQSDGAHYISRTHQATKCIEENVHSSCKRCNLINDVFIQEAYTAYMIDMYGKEFVEELKTMARKPFKHDRIEVQARLKEINRLNKELEAKLMCEYCEYCEYCGLEHRGECEVEDLSLSAIVSHQSLIN